MPSRLSARPSMPPWPPHPSLGIGFSGFDAVHEMSFSALTGYPNPSPAHFSETSSLGGHQPSHLNSVNRHRAYLWMKPGQDCGPLPVFFPPPQALAVFCEIGSEQVRS